MTQPDHNRSTSRTFVLVHGAWRGGWAFARVAELLRAQGHRVYTPTLTGLGERSHLAGRYSIGLGVHIDDVANLIRWERLNDVVLCGHSYGGLVISGVADVLTEAIAALVYMDAMVPEPGKSVLAMNQAAPVVEGLLKATAEAGGSLVPPIPSVAFGTNETDQALVDSLSTPHPLASFCEPVELSGAYLSVASKTYIRATGWSGYEELGFHSYRNVADDIAWTKVDLPYGHELMFNAPDTLARCLVEAAQRDAGNVA